MIRKLGSLIHEATQSAETYVVIYTSVPFVSVVQIATGISATSWRLANRIKDLCRSVPLIVRIDLKKIELFANDYRICFTKRRQEHSIPQCQVGQSPLTDNL